MDEFLSLQFAISNAFTTPNADSIEGMILKYPLGIFLSISRWSSNSEISNICETFSTFGTTIASSPSMTTLSKSLDICFELGELVRTATILSFLISGLLLLFLRLMIVASMSPLATSFYSAGTESSRS